MRIARKRRYKEFLAEKTGTDDVPLPPVPVVTRWNSWFKTVIHHAKYHAYHTKYHTTRSTKISLMKNWISEMQQML